VVRLLLEPCVSCGAFFDGTLWNPARPSLLSPSLFVDFVPHSLLHSLTPSLTLSLRFSAIYRILLVLNKVFLVVCVSAVRQVHNVLNITALVTRHSLVTRRARARARVPVDCTLLHSNVTALYCTLLYSPALLTAQHSTGN
jgi:hypothetical protein